VKTVTEFYKKMILPLKDRITIYLPQGKGEKRIEKDLFGWKLYYGRNFIECRSEEEARYLKIFLDIGKSRVDVPGDLNKLKEILPVLEKIKERIDRIIESNLDGLLDRQMRERIRWKVWKEVSSLEED